MTPTLAQALQKALELEKQGCITTTALSLIVLMNYIRDNIDNAEVSLAFDYHLKDLSNDNVV